MKKMLFRTVALIVGVMLMSGTLGASTSHAALGCKHSIEKQYTYYWVTRTEPYPYCSGSYYEIREGHLHTYFGCKYCDYAIFEGGRDVVTGTSKTLKQYWYHSTSCDNFGCNYTIAYPRVEM